MKSKALTVRMPEDEHNALKLYAFVNDMSLNEAVLQAVRGFLLSQGEETFDRALDAFRSQYRVALDKLADS